MTTNPHITKIIAEYEKLAINTSGFIVFKDTKGVIQHIRWSGDIAREVGMLKAPSKTPKMFRGGYCYYQKRHLPPQYKLGSIQVDLLEVDSITMDKYRSLFQYLAQNSDYSRKALKKNGKLWINGAVGLIKELCYDHNTLPSEVLEAELDYILSNDKVDLRNKQHTLSNDNMLEILKERIKELEFLNNELTSDLEKLELRAFFGGDCVNNNTLGICDKIVDTNSHHDDCVF